MKTPSEQRKIDAAILAKYVREIKHYRAVWGVPPDKLVHLSTWASVKRTVNQQFGVMQ